MGAKYTTNASSGYNSSPPADDGSQVASNLVKWSTQKTKLTDPLKTFIEEVNTDLVAAFDYAVRQISTSDSLVAGDHMRAVEIAPTATTGVTVTLADAATMTNIYRVFIKNSSPHQQTIARATGGDTIDGTAANITIPSKAAYCFTTNNAASGYLIVAGYPLEVTNLTEETAPSESDTIPVYDLSATALRKVQLRYLRNPLTSGTEQASTSGTSIDFTGIPSWAKKIIIQFVGVSTSGTSVLLVQLGDAGGVETTGYLSTGMNLNTSTSAEANYTAGFGLQGSNAATVVAHGTVTLTLEDSANFTWVATGLLGRSESAGMFFSAGSKSLSAALDRVRITTVNGTDTFDAGAINVLYE
jgi:hypothetical protein